MNAQKTIATNDPISRLRDDARSHTASPVASAKPTPRIGPIKGESSIAAFTHFGPLNIRNARFAEDEAPLDDRCACPVCGTYSRAYLHHLVRAQEILGAMLMTQHNLSFYQQLMADMRDAIAAQRFTDFARDFRRDYLG